MPEAIRATASPSIAPELAAARERFRLDKEWQLKMRNKILRPSYYERFFASHVVLDEGRLADELQPRSMDTIALRRNGSVLSIEEKIVRWPEERGRPYTCFALETGFCFAPGEPLRDGWMKTGQGDRLLYCFANQAEDELTCWLVDFPALQDWFWPRYRKFPPSEHIPGERGECRVVSILEVANNVPSWLQVVRAPA